MPKATRPNDQKRQERLEREMRDNLLKRKARAKAKAQNDVDDANSLLDPEPENGNGKTQL